MKRICVGAWVIATVFVGLSMIVVTTSEVLAQQPDNKDQQIQNLTNLLAAEQEKTNALATSAAQLRSRVYQLEQTQPVIINSCRAAVEEANPAKTIDPSNIKLIDKPKSTPEAGRGRGTR